MKRDEILNMPAGQEMDALVLERVLRKAVLREPGGRPHFLTTPYSSDIGSAWEVVEKLKTDGKWLSISTHLIGTNNQWCCEYSDNSLQSEVNVTMADTAPLAICRASLLAIMELEPE